MPISLETEVVRRDGNLCATIGEEEILMDAERGIYVGMNTVGSEIWRGISKPIRVRNLCDELSQKFDGNQTQIRNNVLTYLEGLLEHGLIRITGA